MKIYYDMICTNILIIDEQKSQKEAVYALLFAAIFR